MKKGYAAIRGFYQTYEVETAVLAGTAVYMSMLLARFFWIFQFENTDLKDMATCRMWDRKISVQAVILFFIVAILLALAFCCVLFSVKQRHIRRDKFLDGRQKTGNFFRTYIKEWKSAYLLSVSETMLFFHFVRYRFLEAETGVTNLITYRQLVLDCHAKIFCVCNIALFLLIFPNFAYMVKARRNENIIKILLETKINAKRTQN